MRFFFNVLEVFWHNKQVQKTGSEFYDQYCLKENFDDLNKARRNWEILW